jgi:antirestriction protein ArdC
MAEAVGTRQCSPLRCDERAEERAALTEPASSLPAAQDMKRGHSTKEIWLRAKGEKPSFRFRPARAAQESKRHGIPQSSQRSQQAEHLSDRHRPHYFRPQNGRDSVGETVEDAALCRGPFPRNFYTGKPYRGINVLLLWSSEYNSPFWLTFKQAQALKRTVRKGEHGTPIIFYKQFTEHATKDDDAASEDERVPLAFCRHSVFNMGSPTASRFPIPEIDADELCEGIVTGWKNRPALYLNSASKRRAYYRPPSDSVRMPARSRFVDASHHYSTLFQELVRSTGYEIRLRPIFGDRFGVERYIKEDPVAEMGATYICAIVGITNEHTDRDTIAYL